MINNLKHIEFFSPFKFLVNYFFFSRKLLIPCDLFNLSSWEKFVNFENWKLRYYISCTIETNRILTRKKKKNGREKIDRVEKQSQSRIVRADIFVHLTFSKLSKIARSHLLLRFGERIGSSGDGMNF